MIRRCTFRESWVLVFFSIILYASVGWANPTCEITREDSGPPLTIEFTFQDTTIGIRHIIETGSINADVNIPTFARGTISQVVVTATKLVESGDFSVTVEAEDMDGNRKSCSYTQAVPDNDPPSCQVTAENQGPPFSIEFTIRDTDSGLSNIEVIESLNSTTNVPAFAPGTINPVVVTATKVDQQSQDFDVTIAAEDTAGNRKICSYTQPSVPDEDPPSCQITSLQPGPPASIEFTFQDEGSGLASINQLDAINATVDIPAFTPGSTDGIIVSAGQVFSNLDFSVELQAVDLNDNSTTCRYPAVSPFDVRPEIDAAGGDNDNFFNDYIQELIIANGQDSSGNKINNFSNFTSEYFQNSTGIISDDTCFSIPNRTYRSALTPVQTEATYEWQITLQMKPAADIYLNITSCVLKAGAVDIWKKSRQTGLYRLPWAPASPIFAPNTGPRITAKALPGPFAADGFPAEGFILDSRKLPGLDIVSLANSTFTMETLSEESIVLILPRTGSSNSIGQTMVELNQGDQIRVTISLSSENTTDVRLGNDNVMLKYLGVLGTEYSTFD